MNTKTANIALKLACPLVFQILHGLVLLVSPIESWQASHRPLS